MLLMGRLVEHTREVARRNRAAGLPDRMQQVVLQRLVEAARFRLEPGAFQAMTAAADAPGLTSSIGHLFWPTPCTWVEWPEPGFDAGAMLYFRHAEGSPDELTKGTVTMIA